MKVSFRLSDQDRERFGGDEWVQFDTDQLPDLGYDGLNALEKDIKRYDESSIMRIIAVEWPGLTMLGFRGMAWLARQFSGAEKPGWLEFKPDVPNMTFRVITGDDADPPAGGSSEPPSAKALPANTTRSKKASRS